MNPRFAAVVLSAALLLAACARNDTERSKAELIAADKAFSASSAKDGARAAFLRVIARDCKLLAVDTRSGADAVNTAFLQLPATAKLTWEPAFVDVSNSGEMGYTWGRYQLVIPMSKPGVAPLIRRGTYVTLWKRQRGGKWAVVLDGGNPDGAH
jgi:ketosteroid isomerase-like protein